MKRGNAISGNNLLILATFSWAVAFLFPHSLEGTLAAFLYFLFVAWHVILNFMYNRRVDDGVLNAVISSILLVGAVVQTVCHHL